MAQMLELFDGDLKIMMINMLRALMGKVGNIQEQTGNIRREMETLRKNQKEMLEIRNTITEMKKALDGFISNLDTAKERISEPEDMSVEMSQTEMQRQKKNVECPRTVSLDNLEEMYKFVEITYKNLVKMKWII